MPRGKKTPTLKDAIRHKTRTPKLVPGAVESTKVEEVSATAEAPQDAQAPAVRAAKSAKRTPTLEEVVAKLKQHGIHFDHE